MNDLEQAKKGNLGQLLLRAARLYNEQGVLRVQEFAPNFTKAHTALFPHLDLEGGTRPSELARRMGTTKQAAGQLVNDLVKMGALARVADPDDGRACRVIFTEMGREFMVRGLGVLKTVESEVEDSLSPDSVSELKKHLEALIEVLEAKDS